MTESRHFAVPAFLVTCATLLWAAFPVRAEVGAIVRQNDVYASYIVKSIVDDPEPVGSAWVRYNADSEVRVVLNADGAANGDGDPMIVRSAAGNPIAAWSRNSPGGFDVVVSRFADGAWSSPLVVAGSAADEMDPHLAVDPASGVVHLLYWVEDGNPRVMHRQADADLAAWSDAVQVSQPGEIACRPAAVVHEGVLRVVYEVHDYGLGAVPRQIVTVHDNGMGFTSLMLAVTLHETPNWPQIHSERNRLWVEWIDTDSEMTWTQQIAPGVWEPVQIENFATVEEREYHVRREIRTDVLN